MKIDEQNKLLSIDNLPQTVELRADVIIQGKYPEIMGVAPVVHGHWREKGTDIVCSCCGAAYDFEVLLLYRGEVNVSDYSGFEYCPHCGAQLIEGEIPWE